MNYRTEMQAAAFEARVKEVIEYQVNIDNFRGAIAMIGEDAELQDFKAQLEELLRSSLLEQRKAKIMLEVVRAELEGGYVG